MNSVLHSFQESSTKIVNLLLNKHNINYKSSENTNASGDKVHKIDEKANEIIKEVLLKNTNIYAIASEEEENIIYNNIESGKYLVVFDPLDGSSNIDTSLTVGTIFGIFEVNKDSEKVLDVSKSMIGAAYTLYGPSPLMIWADTKCVKEFNFYKNKWVYNQLLMHPKTNKFYCVNSANEGKWKEETVAFFQDQKDKGLGLRWAGCMVSDVHRIIVQGGVFAYPADREGKCKLRLLYECLPMTFILHKLGGRGWNSEYQNLLKIKLDLLKDIHKKVEIFLSI